MSELEKGIGKIGGYLILIRILLCYCDPVSCIKLAIY